VTELQILLLGVTLFFIYKAYQKFMQMGDDPRLPSQEASAPKRQSAPAKPADMLADADAAYEAGDFLKALNLLESARARDPKNPEVLGRLGFVLAKNDEDFKALEVYQEALAVDPEDDTLHAAIASLYRKKGMPSDAEKHYQEALRIDPEYAITYFNYGNLLLDLDRKEEAKAMYEKALALDPEFAEAKEALSGL